MLTNFTDVLAYTKDLVTPITFHISPECTAATLETIFAQDHAINLADDMILAHTIKNVTPKGNIKYDPLETLSSLSISSSSSSAGNLTHALTQCVDIVKKDPLDGKRKSHVLVIWAGGRSEVAVNTKDSKVHQTHQSKHPSKKKKSKPKLVLIFRPQRSGDIIYAKMTNTQGGTFHVSTTLTLETDFTLENLEDVVTEKQRKDISKTGLPYYDRDKYALYNADTTMPKAQVLLLLSLLLLLLLLQLLQQLVVVVRSTVIGK
jgi:hypothetical protein